MPAADAIVVERMKRAGGIVIGKTNTPEFGLGSNTYNDVFGRTLNAYDQSKTVGRLERRRRRRGGAAHAAGRRRQRSRRLAAQSRRPATTCSASGRHTAACRRRASTRSTPTWACRARWRATCRTSPCCCRCRRATTRACRCRTARTRRNSPGDLRRDFKGVRIAWSGDFGGAISVRTGRARSLQVRAQDVRGAGLHRSKRPTPDFPIEQVWQNWRTLRAWQTGVGAEGPLQRSGQARADEAGSAVRGRERTTSCRRSTSTTRQRRAHRVVSGGAHLLREIRLPRAAVRPGVPVRRRRSIGRRPSTAGPWTPTIAGWR